MEALTADEMRLLRTYRDGPRIWDATELTGVVTSLTVKGLIAPVNDGPTHLITDAGLKASTMKMVLYPNSNTNPSNKYRVVDWDDWYKNPRDYAYIERDTHDEAKAYADTANSSRE